MDVIQALLMGLARVPAGLWILAYNSALRLQAVLNLSTETSRKYLCVQWICKSLATFDIP